MMSALRSPMSDNRPRSVVNFVVSPFPKGCRCESCTGCELSSGAFRRYPTIMLALVGYADATRSLGSRDIRSTNSVRAAVRRQKAGFRAGGRRVQQMKIRSKDGERGHLSHASSSGRCSVRTPDLARGEGPLRPYLTVEVRLVALLAICRTR
jgi:hypothetical protein